MKSFDKITANLRKTVIQLKSLSEYNEKESQVRDKQIASLEVAKQDLDAEKARADAVALKLEELLA